MKKSWNRIIAVFLINGLSAALYAHQPRLVDVQTRIEVSQPEISKAYYGRLAGNPVVFRIEAREPFKLYVNVLVPDLKEADKDVSARLLKDGAALAVLDGTRFDWQKFHEPFAGDDYFRGPEFSAVQEPGTYEIEVYSPDNQGKYVLAIGDKEAFPLGELIHTYRVLPRLKSEFWGKSPFSAYNNIMGIFLWMILVIVALLVLCVVWITKRIRKKLKAAAHPDDPLHKP